MILLGILSALALAIVVERFWTLRRRSVLPPNLGEEVRQWARTRKIEPQHLQALRDNSPLGAVLATVLANRHRSRDVIRSKTEDEGRQVVHELGRYLNTLGTIAIVSPLAGLLGTVFGLIRMFLVITSVGIGDANKLAGGIGEALVATAAGLSVAIFAYLFHRYLRGRVLDYALALEREATLLIDALEEQPVAAPGTVPHAGPAAAARVPATAARGGR